MATNYTFALRYPGVLNEKSFIFFKGKTINLEIDRDDNFTVEGINIDKFLKKNKRPKLAKRSPVIGYGSNASPEQLKNKFTLEEIDDCIPVIKAKISGFKIVYMARITYYGSFPAMLIPASNATCNVFITFLTDEQLLHMHKTESEGVSYHFCKFENTIRLENNKLLNQVYFYDGIYNPLLLHNKPVSIKTSLNYDNESKNQIELLKLFFKSDLINLFPELNKIKPEEFPKFIASNLKLKNNINEYLVNHFGKRINKLKKVYDDSANLVNFTKTISRNNSSEYLIKCSKETKEKLNIKKFGVLRNIYKGKVLYVYAKVLINESLSGLEKSNNLPIIQIDQSLRDAIGLNLDENIVNNLVYLFPLKYTFFDNVLRGINNFLGKNNLFFRVNYSFNPDMEKNICRIEDDAFDVLGIEAGYKVVIENIVRTINGKYSLKSYSIKAYCANQDMIHSRIERQKRMHSIQFPSTIKFFDIESDIPWIFIDLSTRKTLNIDLIQPISVRRNLFNTFLKELRQFGLTFFVSLIALFVTLNENLKIGLVSLTIISLIISIISTIVIVKTKL